MSKLYKLQVIITLIIVLITTPGLSAKQNQPTSEVSENITLSQPQSVQGWDAFIKSDYWSAESSFRRAITLADSNRDAFIGNAMVNVLHSRYNDALTNYRSALRLAPEAPENEAIFAVLADFLYATPEYPSLKKDYEQILQQYQRSNSVNPYLRTQLMGYLASLYYQAGELDKAKKLENQSGYIKKWDFLIGPFNKYGISDIETVFPPERDINQSLYQENNRDLYPRSISNACDWASENVSSLVYPDNGTMYLATRVIVTQSTKGWLGLNTDSPSKIWINGRLVLALPKTKLLDGGNHWIPIELNQGENQVVVKTNGADSNPDFRIQLLDHVGNPMEFKTKTSRLKESKPMNYLTLQAGAGISPKSYPPFSYLHLNPSSERETLLQLQLLSGYQIYPEAETKLLEQEKKYPNFSYLKQLRGELYIKQSQDQERSTQRLTNQAKELFDAVRKQSPDVVSAYRGLARYYISQKQLDTALEIVKQLETTVPGTITAPGIKMDIFVNRDWQKELLTTIEQCTAMSTQYRPAYQFLAQIKQKAGLENEAEPLLRKIYQIDHNDRYALNQLLHNLETQGKYKDAVQLLESQDRYQMVDGNDFIQMGDYQLKLKNKSAARDYYSKAIDWNPTSPAGYEKMGEYQLLTGDTEKALQSFHQALECNPSREELQDRIRLLTQAKPFYAQYDIDIFSQNTSGFDAAHYPRASVIFLLDLMASQFQIDGSSRNYIHQAIQILNKEGREQFEEITIPYNAQLLYAYTIDADGNKYNPTQITPTNNGKNLSMYKVEEGSILEYAYTFTDFGSRSSGKTYSQGLFFFQEKEEPMLLSRAIYTVPDSVAFKYREYPFIFNGTISTNSTTGYTVYQWEKRSSSGIKDEPMMPDMKEVAENIYYSTYPDWKSALQPIYDDINERLITSNWINLKAESLIQNCTTDIDKIQPIYYFVSKNITPGGQGGTVTDTLILGTGSPMDRTLLAKALLDAVHITTDLVLVAPENIPQNEAGIPSPVPYNRPILRVNDTFYLDFSSQYRNCGDLSDSLQGKSAIVISSLGHQFIVTPDKSITVPYNQYKIKLQPAIDGSANIQGEILYSGAMATYYREMLSDPNRKNRMGDEEINRLIPGISDLETKWKNQEELNKTLSLSFKGASANLIAVNENHLVFNPLFNRLNLSRFLSGSQREHPIVFKDTLIHNDYEIQLDLPENLVIETQPGELAEHSPFGDYLLEWKPVTDRQWTLHRSILIPEQRIKKEYYPKFVEFCNKIDSLEKTPLPLKITK